MDLFLHDLDEFSPFALRTKADDTFPPAENVEGKWYLDDGKIFI